MFNWLKKHKPCVYHKRYDKLCLMCQLKNYKEHSNKWKNG